MRGTMIPHTLVLWQQPSDRLASQKASTTLPEPASWRQLGPLLHHTPTCHVTPYVHVLLMSEGTTSLF